MEAVSDFSHRPPFPLFTAVSLMYTHNTHNGVERPPMYLTLSKSVLYDSSELVTQLAKARNNKCKAVGLGYTDCV